MSYSIYNTVGNVFNTFGFIDGIADTVFDLFTLSNEIRLKGECRSRTFILYPARTAGNTRIVRLNSLAVVRKVIRRRASCFDPWASDEEKRLLREARSLGVKMFRTWRD